MGLQPFVPHYGYTVTITLDKVHVATVTAQDFEGVLRTLRHYYEFEPGWNFDIIKIERKGGR